MQIISSIPGYRAYEYRLLICLPHHLQETTGKIKEAFAAQYPAAKGVGGRATITLVNFMQYEMCEARLQQRLQASLAALSPFMVELQNFGAFPKHSIYFNVATRQPLQQLVKTIRSQCGRLMQFDAEHKPHFILDPHVILARKMAATDFEAAWRQHEHLHFSGRFIASEVVLLRRVAGTTNYERVFKVALTGQAQQVAQANLFF